MMPEMVFRSSTRRAPGTRRDDRRIYEPPRWRDTFGSKPTYGLHSNNSAVIRNVEAEIRVVVAGLDGRGAALGPGSYKRFMNTLAGPPSNSYAGIAR
jgi:hypothetical protein